MNSHYDWSIDRLIAQNFYQTSQPVFEKNHKGNGKLNYLIALLRGFFK